MNHAAAIAFTTVMLLGMTGLTWLVYRMRATPTTPDLLDGDDSPLLPRSIYDHTVAAVGDPDHIDLKIPPCPTWPTWHTIPDRAVRAAIDAQLAALSNEH